MDLQPQRGDEKVAIPVTFESRPGVLAFKKSRLIISLIVMLLGIILWIVTLIIGSGSNVKWLVTGIVFVVLPTFCRFVLIKEHSFRKHYNALADANYTYDYRLFWNIYDTNVIDGITFFYHTNGSVSVFVAFDKGVIIGKGDYSDYDHYEAISQAYNLLHKRGIRCTHIDYMDSVGKDVRLQGMYANVQDCENPELQASVLDMIDYMQYQMMGTYADYDVYCFTAKMRPDLMWDELSSVIGAFLGGNYIRDRVLDVHGVRDVLATVLRIPDFSVAKTCDSLFGHRATSFLRVIWIDRNGKRENVNKTRKQIAEEARLAQQEKEARKAMRGKGRKNDDVIVDILGDTTPAVQGTANVKKQPAVFNPGGRPANGAGFNVGQGNTGFGTPQRIPQQGFGAVQVQKQPVNQQRSMNAQGNTVRPMNTGFGAPQQGTNVQQAAQQGNVTLQKPAVNANGSHDDDEIDLF